MNKDYEPSTETLIEVAKEIMAIAAESPEKGNAVMDLIDNGYQAICFMASRN